MEIVKQIMIEYILTNGALPEFNSRLEKSLPYWDNSDEEFIVFRGQGHSKKGIQKPNHISANQLKNSIRPIISSSSDKDYVLHKFTDYSEKKEGVCCLFEIHVRPGIRFLDFNKIPSEYITIESIKDFIVMKKQLDPENSIWPSSKIPYQRLLNIVKTRKESEKEILLDGYQGAFSILDDSDNIANNGRPVRFIQVSYSPKMGGRRIAKTKRRNKKLGKSRKH